MKKIDENLVSNFGDIISNELLAEFKANIDFMSAFCPVGSVAPIMVGLPGVPEPDPNIWQECNGLEIINPNSPLRSQGDSLRYTPNMINRYIRVPINFGFAGNPGGYNETLQFKHNHGGRTTTAGTGGDVKSGSFFGGRKHTRNHSHKINNSFPNPVNVEPPFYTVKFYMRIQ
jgi:hypothetical protein